MHYRTLHASGVELLGRLEGVDGSVVHFADDLAASVDFGDARWAEIRTYIGALCARTGTATPDYEIPPPMRIKTRTEIDLVREGIGTVIWTSGYRPEYGWVKFPVFDDMGFPVRSTGERRCRGFTL